MSSPIALNKKGIIKDILIRLHQRLSHHRRISILSRRIAEIIEEEFKDKDKIHCLDVGCGDMKIAESINEANKKTLWNCIDIYDLPEDLRGTEKWAKYKRFNGVNIPFEDKSMDVVLFCDVLHHAGDNTIKLLKEAARVGKVVIVKDHFEYSFYSRLMLKVMDFIGNWGYGVKLPTRYFTKKGIEDLCRMSGLSIKRLYIGIDLYSHIPIARNILKPKWQFIVLAN